MPTLLPQQFYYPVNPEAQAIRSVDSYSKAEKKELFKRAPYSFMQLFNYAKAKSCKEKNKTHMAVLE